MMRLEIMHSEALLSMDKKHGGAVEADKHKAAKSIANAERLRSEWKLRKIFKNADVDTIFTIRAWCLPQNTPYLAGFSC